ncbi:MAG: pentapeptide repeat-containing protein [Actinomycetota bacterium]
MSTAPRLPLDPDLPRSLAPAGEIPRLRDAELDALVIEGVEWSGQSAQGLRLSESKLSGVDLGGAFLTRGRLRDVLVIAGDWANVMADEFVLRRVRFDDVRLTGVNFSGSTMENVTLSGCRGWTSSEPRESLPPRWGSRDSSRAKGGDDSRA